MPRRLLTPRWLGLHLLALVMVLACVRLGFWQLDRADASRARPVASDEHPVPLSSIGSASGTLPASAAGQLVTAAGRYDPTHQYLVAGRAQGGQDGSWVLAVLQLPDGTGVLVVRGWVPSGTAAPSPPAGPVSVVGRLTASEPPGGDRPVGDRLPAGSVAAVSPIDLLNRGVPYRLYDAYLVLTAQVPAPAAVPVLVPSPQPDVATAPGFYLQHLAYVVLWWVFGGFVLFLWWRMARDELAAGQESSPAQGAG